MSVTDVTAEERAQEALAKALLPYLYPRWPGRWGWTEANIDMKAYCHSVAKSVIEDTKGKYKR